MPVLAVNLLPARERERLLSIATVRGYRLQCVRMSAPGQENVAWRIATLQPGQGLRPVGCRPLSPKLSELYRTKRQARDALLKLILSETEAAA